MELHASYVLQVAEARVTSVQIDEARELYRPAAARASLLYFILNDLHKINPIYQFSLKVSTMHSLSPVLTLSWIVTK